MKKITQVFIVGFAIVLSSCSNNSTDNAGELNKIPETEIEKVSYSLGVNVATGVKSQGLETIDANALTKAFKDVLEGNDLDISEEEGMKILQDFFEKLQAEKAEAGKTKMNDWLSDTLTTQLIHFPFKTFPDLKVQTTESGLQYQIIADGNGVKPAISNKIKVHYYGFLADGTKFDSSLERGEPIEFPLGIGRVIPGWDEAFQLMSVGSKWKLIIPSELAYGPQGRGASIPPNTDLLFIAELISINE